MMSNAMLRTVENEMKKYLVSSPRIIFFDRIEDTIRTLIESVLSKFDATYEEQIYSADSCLYLRAQLRVRKKVIIQLTKVIDKLHLSNMSDPSIKHMINGALKGLRQDIIKNAILHGVSCISEQPDATTPVGKHTGTSGHFMIYDDILKAKEDSAFEKWYKNKDLALLYSIERPSWAESIESDIEFGRARGVTLDFSDLKLPRFENEPDEMLLLPDSGE